MLNNILIFLFKHFIKINSIKLALFQKYSLNCTNIKYSLTLNFFCKFTTFIELMLYIFNVYIFINCVSYKRNLMARVAK